MLCETLKFLPDCFDSWEEAGVWPTTASLKDPAARPASLSIQYRELYSRGQRMRSLKLI